MLLIDSKSTLCLLSPCLSLSRLHQSPWQASVNRDVLYGRVFSESVRMIRDASSREHLKKHLRVDTKVYSSRQRPGVRDNLSHPLSAV